MLKMAAFWCYYSKIGSFIHLSSTKSTNVLFNGYFLVQCVNVLQCIPVTQPRCRPSLETELLIADILTVSNTTLHRKYINSDMLQLKLKSAKYRCPLRFFAIGNLQDSRPRLYSSLPPRESTLAKFVFPTATHAVKDVASAGTDLVTLNGHLHRKPRIMAKRSFAELRDSNGDVIQILMSPEHTDEKFFDILEKSGAEDSVSVTGFIQRKQMKTPDDNKVEHELVVSHFQTLNPAGVEAARLDKLKHANPAEIPPKFRYLQLRTQFYQNALRMRSKAVNLIRNILVDRHNFTEIETPLLFKSTPEGAREFLVPTRSPDRFYALPQSPQQYKQILMSSGFSRYFQIARCFRDEDLRADRQPEFTQVDLEMSFINSSDQIATVIDDIIQNVWNKVGGMPTYKLNCSGQLEKVEFENYDSTKPAFNKLKYIDALTKYGIDKPDLRSELMFTDLSKYFTPSKNPSGFNIVEACVLKGAFDPDQKYKIPHVFTEATCYPKRKPIVLAINTNDDAKTWFKKFLEKDVLRTTTEFSESGLAESLNLSPGDILAFSTRAEMPYENPTPLGKFRQIAIEQFPNKWNRPIVNKNGEVTTDYDRNTIFVGSWVVDFPLFSPVDITEGNESEFPQYDYNRLEATHHPFTMAKIEDYCLLETDPLKVHGEHYDLVINGVEVGGGSRRIHAPELQKYVFESILKINHYEDLFGHLLKALSLGCPPHAGIALGFDRLCAMLIGSASIRDVIAFPKNQSGTDPVVESPTDVPEKTLNEYYITKYNL